MIPIVCVVMSMALTPVTVYVSVFLYQCAMWRAEKYLRRQMKEIANDV